MAHEPGSMDISMHKATYAGVITLFKVGTAALIVLMILLAIFVA